MRKTAKDVIAEVAAKYGKSPADILTKSRTYLVAHPRQEAMFEVYLQCPHLSYLRIARAFGGMDHTTIIWGVKKHCERLGISYQSIRRDDPWHRATTQRNSRIGFVPASPADFRTMVRL